MRTQNLGVQLPERSIRVWAKIEQRCFAVIDFKNRKVVEGQRGEEKQCADQERLVYELSL